MNRINLVCFLCVTFVSTCNLPEKHVQMQEVDKILRNIKADTNADLGRYSAIFFVPATGCGGCISSAEDFVINTIVANKRHDILVMITGHGSKKQAVSRMGKDVVEYPDVFIDLKSNYKEEPFFRQYPKVIFLSNGNPEAIEELQPDSGTSVLDHLSNLNSITL